MSGVIGMELNLSLSAIITNMQNLPLNAAIAFGATVKSFELTLNCKVLADSFFRKLHEICAMRVCERVM
jgi:hypothetical protein